MCRSSAVAYGSPPVWSSLLTLLYPQVLKLDSAQQAEKAKNSGAPSNLSMNQTLEGHNGSVSGCAVRLAAHPHHTHWSPPLFVLRVSSPPGCAP